MKTSKGIKRSLFAISLLFLVLAGCFAPESYIKFTSPAQAVYSAGFDKVWNAVLDTLKELGFETPYKIKDIKNGKEIFARQEFENRKWQRVEMAISRMDDSVEVMVISTIYALEGTTKHRRLYPQESDGKVVYWEWREDTQDHWSYKRNESIERKIIEGISLKLQQASGK
ncbi:MAG: hypothetical protein HY890_05645 [Deltaproteobacteria bacterium]|nr:hypothetical protein [Deltaproteobacteria bacterium]